MTKCTLCMCLLYLKSAFALALLTVLVIDLVPHEAKVQEFSL